MGGVGGYLGVGVVGGGWWMGGVRLGVVSRVTELK